MGQLMGSCSWGDAVRGIRNSALIGCRRTRAGEGGGFGYVECNMCRVL